MAGELFVSGVILGAIGIYALAWYLRFRNWREAKRCGDAFTGMVEYHPNQTSATTSGSLIDSIYISEQDAPR